MPRNLSIVIDESLKLPTTEEIVNHIMLSESKIKKGAKVAVVDDPNYGYNGLIGTVEGESKSNPGFVNVRFESGVSVPLQSILLVEL